MYGLIRRDHGLEILRQRPAQRRARRPSMAMGMVGALVITACVSTALASAAVGSTTTTTTTTPATTTTTPTLVDDVAPKPCPTHVTWTYPTGSVPGPPGSWCLTSANLGANGTDSFGTAPTLGDYSVKVNATAPETITVPVPGGGYFAGLASGSSEYFETYEEDASTMAAVPTGESTVTPTCVSKAASCTIVVPPNSNIASCESAGATCPSQWMFLGVEYFYQQELASGTLAIQFVYPRGAPTTTLPNTSLSIRATTTAPSSGIGVNATVPVTATVTANNGPVNGVTVDQTFASKGVTVSASPLPLRFSLGSGQSRTFSFTAASSQQGVASIFLEARGVDASGNRLDDAARVRFKVGSGVLGVSVTYSQGGNPIVLAEKGQAPRPDTIRLADDDKGEIAQTLTATVQVQNTSSIRQTNVTMSGAPMFSYQRSEAATIQVPISVLSGPTPSANLGTLAPGQRTRVTYLLRAYDNGAFVMTSQVLSTPPGSSHNQVSQGSANLTVLPTALLFFKIDSSSIPAGLIVSGNSVVLTGEVTNRSRTQSLDLAPIVPNISGNAGEGAPDDPERPTQPDGYVPLVAGTLKPGQTVFFAAPIFTAEDGGTRATLTYTPSGKVVNDDNSETPLTSGQIRIGGSLDKVVLHINDTSSPLNADFSDFADGFTKSFTMCAASWVLSSFGGVKELVTNFPSIAGHAVVATGSAALATVQFLAGVEFNVAFWNALSDKQRDAFKAQIIGDVLATSNKFSDVTSQMSDAISNYFATLRTAYANGDWQALGAASGTIAGKALPEIASAVLTDATFSAIGRFGAKQATGAISLAQKIKDSEIVTKGVKTLAGVTEGDNLIAKGSTALKSIYGVGAREAAQLQYWAENRGLLISVRSRNPESLNWIEKFKAVVKPEILKIKNVDAIDVSFLGYLPDDLGSVVFAQPISEAELNLRMSAARLSAAQRTAVLARYSTRQEEWTKWYSTYEGYAKAGRVNIGFDVNAQGVIGPNRALHRRFALEPASTKSLVGYRPAGSEYFRVELGDASGGLGTLRRVTGDIDVVTITKANGEILSSGERAQLYIDLQNGVGMQHGETLSWLKNGDILFDTKAKLLADHLPGGELLAVFGPDGSVRAASINAALTIFNTTTNSVVLHLDGAFAAVKPAYSTYAALSLAAVGTGLSAVNSVPTD